MRLKKRIQNLEKNIVKQEDIPAIAIKYMDGNIDWNDQIFSNEKEFHKAVERAFRDKPPSPGPNVIVINFRRERSQLSC